MTIQRQRAFVVDTTRCVNCKTCEVACRDTQEEPSRRLRRVRSFEHGDFPVVSVLNISMSCNHCAEPACVRQCPTKAYTKRPEDGIVVHDAERCIGCRYCTWACPYGAPQFHAAEGIVRKCDFCVAELERGESPVCIASCPLRAIEVTWMDELEARSDVTVALPELPTPEITRPSTRYRVRKGQVR